jgi:hypothetical protein
VRFARHYDAAPDGLQVQARLKEEEPIVITVSARDEE